MRGLAIVALVAGCWRDAAPAAPPQPAPVPSAPAPRAHANADAFPALDIACAADADCTQTSRFATCCGGCEERYASKAFVARVDAYCEAHPPGDCGPMACSWAMAQVHCVHGECRDRP